MKMEELNIDTMFWRVAKKLGLELIGYGRMARPYIQNFNNQHGFNGIAAV